MQYTSNYNLMLPEGTDVVNLLTQMNPNTSDIDAALFANKQQGVGRATELTAGTVHGITRANTDSPIFSFTATSNWTAGDSMTVDGTAVSVFLSDGTTPDSGAYVINSEVLAIIQGTRVTLIGSRGGIDASDISYDNSSSSLTATNAQDAIDEIDSVLDDVVDYEANWTNIGDGINMRLVGNGLVNWKVSGYTASTTPNTVFTFPSQIPAKYRPAQTQNGVVCITQSVYLAGYATGIIFANTGEIMLNANAQGAVGVTGGGVYSIK